MMKNFSSITVIMTMLLLSWSFIGCPNDSSSNDDSKGESASTNTLVAGKTYKSTSAKMGDTKDYLMEGVDESNYVTLVFAMSDSTFTMTPTGNNMSSFAGSGTYSINGSTFTSSVTSGNAKGITFTGTISADGATIECPVQKIMDNLYISATYVRQ